MSDLTKAIAKAVFDELARHLISKEPLLLSRVEAVAELAEREYGKTGLKMADPSASGNAAEARATVYGRGLVDLMDEASRLSKTGYGSSPLDDLRRAAEAAYTHTHVDWKRWPVEPKTSHWEDV
jgi:hypothetical protein